MSIKNLIILLLIIAVIVCGSILTVNGFNSDYINISPISKQLDLGLDLKGGVYVVLEAETNATGDELEKTMNQTQEVIERRVNALGLTEPNVTIEGTKRIRIELPGVDNAEEAIAAIGKTAQLKFLDYTGNVIVTGKQVKDAYVTFNDRNQPVVGLELNGEGAEAFHIATKEAVSKPKYLPNKELNPERIIPIVLDDQIISMPSVDSEIPNGSATITGSGTVEEASTLAALIRGGALPVNLSEVETSLIGPKLGLDSLSQSVKAAFIGIALVLLFMLIYYRLPGLIADIALILYILIVLWALVGLGAVLTLPGIAALILSIGMAVDANVIIFERIKEEIRNGKSLRASINSGFKRALRTILDANITTFIAGIVLYQFGSGAIKGFAVTLLIGIIASMFTAIVITKVLLIIFSNIKAFNNVKFYGVRKGAME